MHAARPEVLGLILCGAAALAAPTAAMSGPAADDAEPLRIAVVSDLNGSYGSVGHHRDVDEAVGRIIEARPDLVISTGDMVAGQRPSALPEGRVRAMWRAFHSAVSDRLAAASIPFAVTPGNHDASAYPGFERERAIYASEWRDRREGLDFVDGTGFPFDYAIELGDTLLISLDVTVTGSVPDKTLAWLGDLLRRERQRYARAVVFSHVPVWPVSAGRQSESTRDPRLHSLLSDATVDLYLSGHHHAFYPGTLGGVTFISQPCLGSGPRRLIGQENEAPKGYTLLDLNRRGIRVGALTGPGFDRLLDWRTLPAHIGSGDRALTRSDLADVDVAPMTSDAGALLSTTGIRDGHPR